jgi:glycosyltransferase involved in cell wall biosynthesis
MLLSVVIPAFNEERLLPETLSRLREAAGACRCEVETIVADNASTDRTAEIAKDYGAAVAHETVHNIARVRNAGARQAKGDVLVFLDADTVVPMEFLDRIAEEMSDAACVGGSPDIVHRANSRLLRVYLRAWRQVGLAFGMAQGAAQFCRRPAFEALNGYDESQFMGEDVDFYWRLRRHSRETGGFLKFLDDVKVCPSPRRFDNTSVWRTMVWTNPLFIGAFRKKKNAWAAWYVRPPR